MTVKQYRCICVADHRLDGMRTRCLNTAPCGRRKCADCRKPDKLTETELRALWGDR